jgi:hypothetical protein
MGGNEAINMAAAHCPACGAEYRAGFDVCADCGLALEPGAAPAAEDEQVKGHAEPAAGDAWAEATRRVWEEPGAGDDHPEPTVLSRLPLQEAMLLVGRLEEAGIPARVDADLSAYYVDALTRLKSVLVPRSRLEDARRVVAEIESGGDRI